MNVDWKVIWTSPISRYTWAVYTDLDGKEIGQRLIDHGDEYGPVDPDMANIVATQG